MIPASYLYKDVYRRAWLDPDVESARRRHKADRLDAMSMLRRGLAALLRRAADRLHPAPHLASGNC